MRSYSLALALVSCKPTHVPDVASPGPPVVEESAEESVAGTQPRARTISWSLDGKTCESAGLATDAIVAIYDDGLERRERDTGALTWRRPIRGWLSNDDETAYVATGADLIAVDIDGGAERWRHSAPAGATFQSPVAIDGETLYVADNRLLGAKQMIVGPSWLHALDAETGALRWNVELPTGVIAAAPTFDRERIYVVREFGLSAVSKARQAVEWSTHQATSRTSAVAVADRLLVPAHKLFGVSAADGSEAWNIPGHTLSTVEPQVHEGLAYAVIPAHRRVPNTSRWFVSSLAELEPAAGELRWQQWFEQPVRGTVAVTADRIHAAAWDGKLYELDRRSGEVRWSMDLGLGKGSPTVLTDDEAVYVCGNKRLLRIDLPPPEPRMGSHHGRLAQKG
ncbi:MAG: PQQ-binding-like beta-propeller repeat protein [Nannocystales bacterium]